MLVLYNSEAVLRFISGVSLRNYKVKDTADMDKELEDVIMIQSCLPNQSYLPNQTCLPK